MTTKNIYIIDEKTPFNEKNNMPCEIDFLFILKLSKLELENPSPFLERIYCCKTKKTKKYLENWKIPFNCKCEKLRSYWPYGGIPVRYVDYSFEDEQHFNFNIMNSDKYYIYTHSVPSDTAMPEYYRYDLVKK